MSISITISISNMTIKKLQFPSKATFGDEETASPEGGLVLWS
jgi:hypothetical protein